MKAISTLFDGHHYRSRLEARWGVAFKALGIDYRYEPEGYILEGKAYLPDFYLPLQDCFVEIKGKEPTEEEREKARLLSLYTGKNVHTFYGDVWIPGQPGSYQSYLDMPPKIWAYRVHGSLGDKTTHLVMVPPHVLVVIQKLHDRGIEVYLREGNLSVEPTGDEYYTVEDFMQFAQLLDQNKKGIIQALTPDEGWKIDWLFQDQDREERWGGWWQECIHCGALEIRRVKAGSCHSCQDGTLGVFRDDTQRLIAAYTAARSARFEYGERG